MTLDELITAVRAAVGEDAGVLTRASLVADLVRAATGHRWVGVYSVDDGEVVNLAWSGSSASAGPALPTVSGLTEEAVRTRLPSSMAAATGAELIIPVLAGESVVGTLAVEDERAEAFDRRRVDHLVLVAAELAPLVA